MNTPPNQNNRPAWVQWLAQDADGVWWGFEAEPHQADISWYENEVGRYVRLESAALNTCWRESLRCVNRRLNQTVDADAGLP